MGSNYAENHNQFVSIYTSLIGLNSKHNVRRIENRMVVMQEASCPAHFCELSESGVGMDVARFQVLSVMG